MSTLPAAVLLLMAHALPTAPGSAARSVGLLVSAPAPATPLLAARLADGLMETLSATRLWEATVLTPEAALLRASGATWPSEPPLTAPGAWRDLATTIRLDDLVALQLETGPQPVVRGVWVRPTETGARLLSATAAGPLETALPRLCQQLLAQLQQGFAQAPGVSSNATEVVPAPAAGPTPATPGAPVPVKPSGATPQPEAPATPPAVPAATTTLTPPSGTTPGSVPVASPPSPPAPPTTAPAVPPSAPPPAPAAAPPPARSEHFTAAEQFLREGDLRKAEDAAQRALDAGDPRGQVCMLMARIQAARGNAEEQRRWLERALAADASLVEGRLLLAEQLRAQGLWSKALDEYQTVLKADPQERRALLGMATVYGQQGQPKRAAEMIAEVIKSHPEEASLYLRLGEYQAQRNALAEAEAAFDRAARLAKDPADKATALDRLGDLYIGAQRYREGFACYAEASKLRSNTYSPLAERRYQQVMAAADQGLQRVLERAGQALTGYVAQDGTVREEAYAALTELRNQTQEVATFLESIQAPAAWRLDHARRKLACSLVLEAAVSGMLYLDAGRADMLANYRTRLNEARALFESLKSAKGASANG